MRLARFSIAVLLLVPACVVAATSSTDASNPGVKDICYNERAYLQNTQGATGKDGTVTAKQYSKGLNFQKCEDQKITKANCKVGSNKDLVGTVTYTDLSGTSRTLNRCDTLAGTNTYCIGDSNCTNMQLYTGISGGNPTYGATPSQISDQLAQTTIEDPQNAKIVLSECSNDPSQCSTCSDPNSDTCPIKSQIDALTKQGVPPGNISCMGVSSGNADLNALNPVISGACQTNGANFLGALPDTSGGQIHSDAAGYQGLMDKIGTFETPPSDLMAGGDFGGGSDVTTAPSTNQCGIGNWAGMIAYAESYCGENPKTFSNCGTTKACGTLQFLPGTYDSYLQQYEQSTGDLSCAGTTAADTGCAVKVTNSFYDNWLQSSAGQSCVQTLGSQSQCVYGYHLMGSSGLQSALNLYNADPNQPATAICSTAAASNCSSGNMSLGGLTMSQMFQKLDTRMGVGSSDVVTTLASGSGGAGTFEANYGIGGDFGGGSNVIAGPTVVQSNGTTFSANYGTNGSLQKQLQNMMLMQMLMGPAKSLFSGLFGGSNQSTAQPASPPPPPSPTAAISALPNPVTRGTSLSLSWSSNGTSLTQVCQVKDQNGMIVGQGDGGTQSISIGSTTPATLTFTMHCTGVNGQQVQQSTSVVVQ